MRVTAIDGFGGTVYDDFTLTINDKPAIQNPIPDTNVVPGNGIVLDLLNLPGLAVPAVGAD